MKSLQLFVMLLAIVVAVASAVPARAQITIGGSSSGSGQSNRNRDNDDDDDDNNGNNGNNQNASGQGNRSGSSNNQSGGNSSSQKMKKYLESQGINTGNQGGNNQNGSNQGDFNNQGGNFNNQDGNRNNRQNQNSNGQNWNNNNRNNNWNNQNWNNNNGSNTFRIGTWQNGKWNGSNKIQNWSQSYGGQNAQPFSAQWYSNHPKAWKYDNNNANVWVVASLPGVYNWLGWGNVPQQYQGNYGNVQQFDTQYYGDWYPLGVYSLMSGPDDSGTRIVQIVVDRHGHIAGNYYDMITNSNYSISGDISRQSQNVSFSLNKNPGIRFRTHVSQLLQPYGGLTVRLPGGEQQWQFVRLEN